MPHRLHSFGNPFHDLTVAQACELAEKDFRLVFVYVSEPGTRACSYLERPTTRDWQEIDLLIRETVTVKLDSRADAHQLRAYQITQLPVMLLLNQDGSERRRFTGDLSAKQLMEQLADDLSGDDSLARARQAVAAAKDDIDVALARERLADTLSRRGALAEALNEYLWCVEVGLKVDSRSAAARRLHVFTGFAALAQRHPPARQALNDHREAMERALLARPNEVNTARDVAELNRILQDEARSLDLYDQVPPRSRARYVLFHSLIEHLIERKRYDEVLAVIHHPKTEFGRAAIRANARGTRPSTIARGAAFVEALAGTGQAKEARALIDAILRFEDTPETRALLKNHAQRVDQPDLVSYIESRPPRS